MARRDLGRQVGARHLAQRNRRKGPDTMRYVTEYLALVGVAGAATFLWAHPLGKAIVAAFEQATIAFPQ